MGWRAEFSASCDYTEHLTGAATLLALPPRPTDQSPEKLSDNERNCGGDDDRNNG